MNGNDVAANGEEVSRQSAFSRVMHSIRTQYSLATAFFLLVVLAVFYIGGRIVLVHMMREAEAQVKSIGLDISRLAYKNADKARRSTALCAGKVREMLDAGAAPGAILDECFSSGLALYADYDSTGAFRAGALRANGSVETLELADFAPYSERLASWIAGLKSVSDHSNAVGLMQVRSSPFYVSLVPSGDGWTLLGSPFDSRIFSAQVNEGFSGIEVKISDRKAAVTATTARRVAPGQERNAFGLAPMLSEALDFYSGGFWAVNANPFEAVFAVRDISGNAITMIALSLPKTLSTVTQSALGRLTFFIAMAGIILILPIFWFQSYVLLNPLTRMTEEIKKLGEHHRDTDCPRLEWKGKDEFALLAVSVNRMLETLSARSLRVAQIQTRQRALISGLPDALAIFDRRGRLIALNKQPEGVDPLVGFSMNEPPDEATLGRDGVRAFSAGVERVFSSGEISKVELSAANADGSRRFFEARLSKMDDHFALATIRDVTREHEEHELRLAAENRAHEASKRESLALLAAGIAHDVNNVLSVILSSAEAAYAGSDGKNAAADTEMAAIRDAVKRGSTMAKELMAYAGEQKITLVRSKSEEIVHDVEMLAERVIKDNVALSYNLASGLPAVDADPNQFWKVLFNIVKNAGEAIGDRPGHIRISTERFTMTKERSSRFISEAEFDGVEGVMFRIADDGPGIPPAMIGRLFDPYVSSKALGRGLGLATVRTIVEAHGGGIAVDSKVGEGTTFSIFLPASKLPEPVAAAATADRLEGAPAEKRPAGVMIVDDEAILKMTSMLLKALKVPSFSAKDRTETLGTLSRRSGEIGTILLDAGLGDVDPVRLLDAIRIAAPGARVIISSGSSEENLVELFAGHPYDGFLGKPYTLAELKAAIA